MDLPLFLPGSHVAWRVHLVCGWAPLGFVVSRITLSDHGLQIPSAELHPCPGRRWDLECQGTPAFLLYSQLPGALNAAPLRGELLLLVAGSRACDGAGVTGFRCSSLRLKLRRSSVAEPQEEDFLSILSPPRANPWAFFCMHGPAHTWQPTLLRAGAGGDSWRGEFPAPRLQQTSTFVASEQNPGHKGLLSPHLVAVHFCWCV